MKVNALWLALVLSTLMPMLLCRKVAEQNPLPPVSTQVQEAQQAELLRVRMPDSTVQSMELEQYMVGVLLGEMPVDFEPEALKAQAVAARTLAVKSKKQGFKHDGADVCTSSGCCQAYLSEEAFLEQGGSQEALKKVRLSVSETAGEVLTYEGELIEATYFSCSGGRTEDAVAVWGTEIPYLGAKDSPGEEQATHFTDTMKLSTAEFASKLGMRQNSVPITVDSVAYTQGGGVDKIILNGKTYTGMQMRKALGLRSTAFVIRIVGDSVTITTRGFGHRVGMSQYGAEAMAVRGSNYREILSYYYPGTELVCMEGKFDK